MNPREHWRCVCRLWAASAFIFFLLARATGSLEEQEKELHQRLLRFQESTQRVTHDQNAEQFQSYKQEVIKTLYALTFAIDELSLKNHGLNSAFNLTQLRANLMSDIASSVSNNAEPVTRTLFPIVSAREALQLQPLVRGLDERYADAYFVRTPSGPRYVGKFNGSEEFWKQAARWVRAVGYDVNESFVLTSPQNALNKSAVNPLSPNEVPLSVLRKITSVEQFLVLKTFLALRSSSKRPADWNWFNILLQEARGPERAHLIASMLVTKKSTLPEIVKSVRLGCDELFLENTPILGL